VRRRRHSPPYGGIAGIWGPWEYSHGINTVGTQNVLDACHACGVRKIFTEQSERDV
jgi:nucleoside-diphosphate-sugar epimerase